MTTSKPSAITYPHESPPNPGEAIQVADGIFWLRMPLPFALNHINLWLLEDHDESGEGWTIVDTGYGVETTHALWRQHFTTTMRGLPIKRIIVTHFHPDHVGCAAWLHAQTQAPFYMTTSEYLSAHAAVQDFAGFDRANSEALFVAHGLARARPDFAEAQKARTESYQRGVPTVPTRYRRLMEHDVLTIGNRRWRIITAFGHAPEHACLFSTDGNILISGDQVLPRITTNVGVWGNQPDANPLAQFLTSMDKFRPLPADTLILPSHDRVFTGLHTRLDQLVVHHQERLDELAAALDTPKTAAEILPVLFRRPLDHHQLVFAIGEAIAHLHYLWYAGRATRAQDADGLWVFKRVARSVEGGCL
ncbi:MAG: MBL fold metallo-hydrolase [Betaproteobacteria bacterium]|jgi:glyoxylase-like metal-dependent hydrolase (beta-lactamase superfamily II)